jgi:hypothetical protein
MRVRQQGQQGRRQRGQQGQGRRQQRQAQPSGNDQKEMPKWERMRVQTSTSTGVCECKPGPYKRAQMQAMSGDEHERASRGMGTSGRDLLPLEGASVNKQSRPGACESNNGEQWGFTSLPFYLFIFSLSEYQQRPSHGIPPSL